MMAGQGRSRELHSADFPGVVAAELRAQTLNGVCARRKLSLTLQIGSAFELETMARRVLQLVARGSFCVGDLPGLWPPTV